MSEIWKALLEVQKEAPTLQRDGLNPHFKSKYVTLETVLETVLPILNRHGVVLMQTTDEDDNLITVLVHAESGEDLRGWMKLRVTKDDPQGYGSAMTYARRYAIMGMLGLVADADDDGNAASAPKAKPKPKEDTSAFPSNWAELKTAMSAYGPTAWEAWLVFGGQAKMALFGEEMDELTKTQKGLLWEATLVASQWFMVKHDPNELPPPTRNHMREAWAVALDGRELEGPAWAMDSSETERPARA